VGVNDTRRDISARTRTLIASVIADVPALGRRRFDYLIPQHLAPDIRVGTRVRIEIHGRKVAGWVCGFPEQPETEKTLRTIRSVSGWGPPEEVIELAQWVAWRYAMPLSTLLRSASPDKNVYELPTPLLAHPVEANVSHSAEVTLERVGPTTDPLPAVLETIAATQSGTVLVMTPSIGWSERLAERLRRRTVAVAKDWAQARAGWPVVVGSRRGALSPIPKLGAVVVLDAHDYRGRADAAVVIAERARRTGAPCRLITPTPSAALISSFGPVRGQERSEERAGWAKPIVVDRRASDPREGLYSAQLVSLFHGSSSPIVCVLNRTGRARLLSCARCGEIARCEHCGDRVVEKDDRLLCLRCHRTRPMLCASCGSERLKMLRIGVKRAREELEALLSVKVGDVAGDNDTIPDTSVIVGTEAVLHRVRHCGAVAFLDFDQHLLAPRLNASEESLALLAKASRIVGGRKGVVLVQTRLPTHPVLTALREGDPSLAPELGQRRQLGLPPSVAWATLKADAQPTLPGVSVSDLGEGRYLIAAPSHQVLCDALVGVGKGITVDPVDL